MIDAILSGKSLHVPDSSAAYLAAARPAPRKQSPLVLQDLKKAGFYSLNPEFAGPVMLIHGKRWPYLLPACI
jgi:hypothetical protein